MQIFTSNNYS